MAWILHCIATWQTSQQDLAQCNNTTRKQHVTAPLSWAVRSTTAVPDQALSRHFGPPPGPVPNYLCASRRDGRSILHSLSRRYGWQARSGFAQRRRTAADQKCDTCTCRMTASSLPCLALLGRWVGGVLHLVHISFLTGYLCLCFVIGTHMTRRLSTYVFAIFTIVDARDNAFY